MVKERQGAVLGFPRGPDPTSIKLYQCSILLGDWKHEVVQQHSMEELMMKMKLQHLGQ